MPSQPTPLDASVSYEDATATFDLGGELDVQNSDRLRALVQAALAMRCTEVVLDCERVRFMDSSALAAVVVAAKETRQRGGRTVVRNASDPIRKLLAITGIDTVVDVT
ncbi:STAS domain-containing protein [Aquihabitans sp. G128]|uniref:STAS domain-containing protein n=1 Tax=Aquihabitans sp. G128 TaxID=2849779 RepID=UPI001C2227F6|nr:STAS domain-containing protein [Aquihabitans sp. G128]QXC60876.1 STAS domain-containing protein [Aquihabitans sp. G128]